MKAATIGLLAMPGRSMDHMVYLEAEGFDLSKKVFHREEKGARHYFQAETAEENRALRLSGMDSVFLAKRGKARSEEEADRVGAYR